MVQDLVFCLIIISILLFQLIKKRAFIALGWDICPKKEDAPFTFWATVLFWVVMLVIQTINTFQRNL
jgi:hypothetical protein